MSATIESPVAGGRRTSKMPLGTAGQASSGTQTAAKRGGWRRVVQGVVAAVMISALVAAADWRSVWVAASGLRWQPLLGALALFVPQTLVSAIRWREWCRPVAAISLAESTRQILATSAMNLVLPSKAGDLTKAAMLPGLDAGERKRAAMLAVVEKLADVIVLAACVPLARLDARLSVAVVVALLLASILVRRRAPLIALAAATALLWTLHLAQIHLFLHAAGVDVAWSTTVVRVPLAIFVGLLPISFCGFGTRDAALVWLFADVATAATMTVVGLLTALRYVVPGAAGIAFAGRYVPSDFGSWRRRRAQP